jgi:membrane protein YqaA with SNARE-associated domain
VTLSVRHFLTYLVQYGPLGLFLLSVADDSFLFMPIGSDLLLVILIARHHQPFVVCVLAAAIGSTVGVFILDLVCRKGGEEGLKRMVKPKLLATLKARIEKHGVTALILACLAPPPFPFGAYIAVASAFQYARPRLLGLVFVARTFRYGLIGWAAIHFGSHIIAITKTTEFLWFIYCFIAICVIGSAFSIYRLVHNSAPEGKATAAQRV